MSDGGRGIRDERRTGTRRRAGDGARVAAKSAEQSVRNGTPDDRPSAGSGRRVAGAAQSGRSGTPGDRPTAGSGTQVVGALVGRNLRLFFRDRLNVFFSLLGAIILFLLYTLFLARLQIDGLKDTFPQASETEVRAFVDTWMFAGIVLLATITTGVGALSTLVEDAETGRFRDFLVAPIRRGQLVLGYLLSAMVVAVVMSLVVLALSIVYLGLVDDAWLPVDTVLRIVGLAVLCCAGFTALSAVIVSFIRTSGAYSGFATVIGTVLGFVAGAYIPVGSLPDGVAGTINALPFAQGAMLLRRQFTRDALTAMTGGQADATDSIRQFYGIDAYVGDWLVPASLALGVLVAMAVGFTLLSAARIRTRIR